MFIVNFEQVNAGWLTIFPVGIYSFKNNNGNTRTMCEICSKLTIKMPERRHQRHSGVFVEQISLIAMALPWLSLNR